MGRQISPKGPAAVPWETDVTAIDTKAMELPYSASGGGSALMVDVIMS